MVFDYIKKARKEGIYSEGKKHGARMQKIASVPMEVDVFFSRIYGNDYFRDPDFFTRVAPEWRVVDASASGHEDDAIIKIAQGFKDDD